MPQIPIFLATLVALTAVLLLGPQWGVVLGLASFAASDTLLLRRELRALRRQLDQMQAELPLQVYEQVTQRIDKVERILDAPKPTSVESVVTTPQAPSALPETATRDGAATETASGSPGEAPASESAPPQSPLSKDEAHELLDAIRALVAVAAAHNRAAASPNQANAVAPAAAPAAPESATTANRRRRRSVTVVEENHEYTDPNHAVAKAHVAPKPVADDPVQPLSESEIPEVVEELIQRVAVVLAENIRVSPRSQKDAAAPAVSTVDMDTVALPPKSVDPVRQQWQQVLAKDVQRKREKVSRSRKASS